MAPHLNEDTQAFVVCLDLEQTPEPPAPSTLAYCHFCRRELWLSHRTAGLLADMGKESVPICDKCFIVHIPSDEPAQTLPGDDEDLTRLLTFLMRSQPNLTLGDVIAVLAKMGELREGEQP